MPKDIYDDLKAASPEDLLLAFKLGNDNLPDDFIRGLNVGFKIAMPSGWECVAPAWLRMLREYQRRQ